MAEKELAQQEINSFVSGIITEASQLNFPPTASRDEQNWVLNRDGTRNRRLGFDSEEGSIPYPTYKSASSIYESAVKTYRWENAGDDASNTFIVTQVGQKVVVHRPGSTGVTVNDPIGELDLTEYGLGFQGSKEVSWTTVNGKLIGAWGGKNVLVIEYSTDSDGAAIFEVTTDYLRIRDLFGLEDKFTKDDGSVIDLNSDNYISYEPQGRISVFSENIRTGQVYTYVDIDTLTDNHLYNLRNQTWGEQTYHFSSGNYTGGDPILSYMIDGSEGYYPANNKSRILGMTYDPEWPKRYVYNPRRTAYTPFGHTRAPTGYFIIDALDRGESRDAVMIEMYEQNPDLELKNKAGYNKDSTPGGATVVAEFSGHVFYAGFSGEVVDGDSRSPNLSSYILFSQLIKTTEDAFKCYQAGDPTSEESSDIVATDGGFIRIAGAYGISNLINIGTGLLILAKNGTWFLSGGADYGFSADQYLVRKLTNRGVISANSAVAIDNTVFYWANDGIYMIAPDEVGEYNAQNITKSTIQKMYGEIANDVKENARGVFDSYSRKIVWIYNYSKDIDSPTDIQELVFDVDLSAFSRNVITIPTDTKVSIIDVVEAETYTTGSKVTYIYDSDVPVTDDGEEVVQTETVRSDTSLTIKYLILFEEDDLVSFTYGQYSDITYKDWVSLSDNPVDAYAYLTTGANLVGDSQRQKSIPYLTFHLGKSETGYDDDYNPVNESSCLCTFMWDWSNSANSNRWSKPIQLYRHKRFYVPEDSSDSFDNGYETVVSKTKIRGRGRAFSMHIETEPEKDCVILGWGLFLGKNSR